MDVELIKQLLQGEKLWYEISPPPLVRRQISSFLPYPIPNTPRVEAEAEAGAGPESGGDCNRTNGNVNKRMIEFLRKSWATASAAKDTTTTLLSEKERCFRHMLNERMRREKQKTSFSQLHSMLPLGTKNDKITIVQTAAKRVEELEWLKKELVKRNYELLQASLSLASRNQYHNEMQNNNNNNNKLQGTTTAQISVKIDNPKLSGIDSMLEVLKCLKSLDSKPTIIHSNFTNQQFLALMDIIQTHHHDQKGAAEVEKAVNTRVQEAERKLLLQERWTRTRTTY